MKFAISLSVAALASSAASGLVVSSGGRLGGSSGRPVRGATGRAGVGGCGCAKGWFAALFTDVRMPLCCTCLPPPAIRTVPWRSQLDNRPSVMSISMRAHYGQFNDGARLAVLPQDITHQLKGTTAFSACEYCLASCAQLDTSVQHRDVRGCCCRVVSSKLWRCAWAFERAFSLSEFRAILHHLATTAQKVPSLLWLAVTRLVGTRRVAGRGVQPQVEGRAPARSVPTRANASTWASGGQLLYM
jgi:hypothetical protein